MLRILLSGFEPFDRDTVNPSWEVAQALDGWQVEGATVQAVQLPCVFGAALERLDAALADGERPVLVVALGLAGGRTEVTPERAALNLDDARIPDNAGQQPVDRPVVADGPAAYFSTLPIKAIVHALRSQGLPASVSNTAGTFVCNHLFYGLMHRLATRSDLQGVRGGFVHVPALPEQAARMPGMPSLDLATQVQGLRILLHTALTVQTDLREQGGSLH
ncbi:pyroglutamyl-peptidase I [uncultured Pseudacidovorax sp.]|uniref:pyroglutamyl-peptidase I n=1 Tax=uncultured Pseudacidovorax sp. TaxID=679313 RepID=UPI0025F3D977|nr:pyroglutamyl-peptidase I [uncultured Pseudacidovorax sp.]